MLGMLLNVVSADDDTDGNVPLTSACSASRSVRSEHSWHKPKQKKPRYLLMTKSTILSDMSDGQAQTVLHLLKDNETNK
nr:hypothetical protein [Bartonella henselae]